MSRAAIYCVGLLGLGLLACAPQPDCHGKFHFHESFPAAWRGAATAGVAKWNAFASSSASLEERNGDDTVCSFRVVDSHSSEGQSLEERFGRTAAAIALEGDGSVAFIPDHWTHPGVQSVEEITRHELGHTFGLEHVTDPKAVMYGRLTHVLRDYNATDRAECERAGACS